MPSLPALLCSRAVLGQVSCKTSHLALKVPVECEITPDGRTLTVVNSEARAFTALPDNIGPKTNPARGPGEEESRTLDFSRVDRARGLGTILWKVMRTGEPVPTRMREADAAAEPDEAEVSRGPDAR